MWCDDIRGQRPWGGRQWDWGRIGAVMVLGWSWASVCSRQAGCS